MIWQELEPASAGIAKGKQITDIVGDALVKIQTELGAQ
jgi:hypothetical protein